MLVNIEQRLQDKPMFLILPADEAVVVLMPTIMGLLGRQLIVGAIIGVLLWYAWTRLKGDGGVESLLSTAYWYTPSAIRVFEPFPDSAIDVWEA